MFVDRIREKKELKLSLGVKSFGPISSGMVDLKPLTIFIGPNNSGKSYLAMLIHSILESIIFGDIHFFPDKFVYDLRRTQVLVDFLFRKNIFTKILNKLSDTETLISRLEDNKEIIIPRESIEKVMHIVLDEIFVNRLEEEIIRSYATLLSDLVNIGKKSFELKLIFNSYKITLTYQKDKLRVKEYPSVDFNIMLRSVPHSRIPLKTKQINENLFLIEIGKLPEEAKQVNIFPSLVETLLEICIIELFTNIMIPCYYLPAARSGILQGHKALVASIIRKSPFAGIERLEIPKFSGVVSDFISSIIELPDTKGPFCNLEQMFEQELIKGEVTVRMDEDYRYPEIRYKFKNVEIPLHRASSTVSELAPLFLYLRYYIKPGSILIIEEPEAHLHPKNQRILAKYLVRLIRKGVRIIITTHSDYLVSQLNNFLLLSKIDPKKRVEKYGYEKDDYLTVKDVAAYVFQYDKKSDEYKIVNVEITEEDGISEDEFTKIQESLYEEAIRLRKEIDVTD